MRFLFFIQYEGPGAVFDHGPKEPFVSMAPLCPLCLLPESLRMVLVNDPTGEQRAGNAWRPNTLSWRVTPASDLA